MLLLYVGMQVYKNENVYEISQPQHLKSFLSFNLYFLTGLDDASGCIFSNEFILLIMKAVVGFLSRKHASSPN